MNKFLGELKKSAAAKVASFVLIIILGAVMLASGLLTAVGFNYGLYIEDNIGKAEVMDTVYNRVTQDVLWLERNAMLEERVNIGKDVAYLIRDDEGKIVAKSPNIDERDSSWVRGAAMVDDEGTVFDEFKKTYEVTVFYKDIKDCGFSHVEQNVYLAEYAYDFHKASPVVFVVSAALILLLLGFWVFSAGVTEEGIKKSLVERIPLDLLTAICIAIILILAVLVAETMGYFSNVDLGFRMFVLGVSYLVCAIIALVFLGTVAVRIRTKEFLKNNITYKVLLWIKKLVDKAWAKTKDLLREVPFVWKYAVVIIGGGLVVMFVALVGFAYYGGLAFVSFALIVLATVGLLKVVIDLNKIKMAANKLAEGDISYKMETKGMRGDIRVMAEDINKIGDGMSKALEDRLQSERFKTELITNVSHDIKTPLTSIINYTDLLSKANVEDEEAKSHIEVLNRQSLRLKKLLEDLIEASKAATGAITINRIPCNLATLVKQTVGEYEEKLANCDLSLVVSVEDDNALVLADGRRTWRVFENLLNNICKYSQPNTRVYVDLTKVGDRSRLVFKNTSKYQLNMSGDELMQRFVRGDKSRNTEGSGLGLSIAKNLIELQDASLDIEIDGDLFKVIIEFENIKY